MVCHCVINYIVPTGWSPGINADLDDHLVINLDNCPSQNKNNSVLRLANLLVERRLFQSLKFNFLVKGHTKNACDRCFNLMKKNYHLRNICTKDQAIAQLGSHEDVTVINTSPSMFYDVEIFLNKLHKKHPSSTIMKSHCFTEHFDDPTSVHAKIASNTTEELVCDLMKGTHKGAKILTSPTPVYVHSALQDDVIGHTVQDIHDPDDDSPPLPDDAILTVPPAGPPLPGPLPLSPSGPLLRPPPGPPPRKRKFAAATITKAVTAAINKIIKNVEKRSKLLLEIQQKKQQRFDTIKAWDVQQLTPPGMQDVKQVDLCQKCRRFIPKTYQNEICPKPSADKIQLIKSQRSATSKKRKEKLKAIKNNVEDGDGLIDSEDIVMDDDGSGAHVVVNEEESDDGGESDAASSYDADSEVEEE